MMPEFEVLFFGCSNGGSGHYLRSPNLSLRMSDTPWGSRLDGGLLEAKGVKDGDTTVIESHLDGWTAISFWDRSGYDKRPGGNTSFLVYADVSKDALIGLAKAQWPQIFNRKGFPLQIPNDQS